jgi:hypothetical protein
MGLFDVSEVALSDAGGGVGVWALACQAASVNSEITDMQRTNSQVNLLIASPPLHCST